MAHDTNRTEFGRALVRLRARRNISQTELAAEVDASRGAIAKWELRSKPPPKERVIKLAKALGADPKMLWELAAADRADKAAREHFQRQSRIARRLQTEDDVIELMLDLETIRAAGLDIAEACSKILSRLEKEKRPPVEPRSS